MNIEEIKSNFSDNLKNLIKESGKSNNKIAKDLGITYQALANYKNGRIPQIEMIFKIKEYFNVELKELLETKIFEYVVIENTITKKNIKKKRRTIMNIEDYRAVRINDCGDENVSYGVIMLNNKHTIKEFQQAINEVKNKYFDEGELDWQVDDILADERLNEFDWFEIPCDCYDYVEV